MVMGAYKVLYSIWHLHWQFNVLNIFSHHICSLLYVHFSLCHLFLFPQYPFFSLLQSLSHISSLSLFCICLSLKLCGFIYVAYMSHDPHCLSKIVFSSVKKSIPPQLVTIHVCVFNGCNKHTLSLSNTHANKSFICPLSLSLSPSSLPIWAFLLTLTKLLPNHRLQQNLHGSPHLGPGPCQTDCTKELQYWSPCEDCTHIHKKWLKALVLTLLSHADIQRHLKNMHSHCTVLLDSFSVSHAFENLSIFPRAAVC